MVLLRGPAPSMPKVSDVDSERLVTLSAGNARLIRLAARLDGPAAAFGRAFWNVIASESLLTIAAIKTHGARSVEYIDRYLVTPLNLRLLYEVLTAMPHAEELAQIKVLTARLEKFERPGWRCSIHFQKTDSAERSYRHYCLMRQSIFVLRQTSLTPAV